MAEIARLTSTGTPDIGALSIARMRLSQASTERTRFLTTSILPALASTTDDALLAELARLRIDLIDKRQVSSEHVARWSSRAIEADWPGYRQSSMRIRRMMASRIALERDILYEPLARRSD